MRFKINWGIPVYILSLIVFTLNLGFIYYLVNSFHPVIFLFFIPAFVLDIIFYSVFRTLLLTKYKYTLIISPKGIEINRRLHLWDSIRSISFQTGRLEHDFTAFHGIKLPVLQRIYILDREGKEYSVVIDIDYFLKGERKKNNLILAKEMLADMGKTAIISDWAEKR
jgi:hypothetical protein